MLRSIFIGTVAFLIATPVPAETITQVMAVRQGGHDTSYTPYSQFDPRLGVLTGVRLDFTNGLAQSNNWTFTCDLGSPVVSTDTIYASLVYGDRSLDLTRSFVDTFTAQPGIINHQVLIPFAGNTVISGPTTRWIGTGVNVLGPDTEISRLNGFAGTTIPGIFVFCDSSASITFTEIITYTYQRVVPEPTSWLLWAMGLTGVILVSGRVDCCSRFDRRERI